VALTDPEGPGYARILYQGSASASAGADEGGTYEVATRITVRVSGPLGLDGPNQLRRALERETELDWSEQSSADDTHLSGGLAEILLVAIVSKSAEMAFGGAVEQAREGVHKVVEHWREQRLDPPKTVVEETDEPDVFEGGDASERYAEG
jgi:hypothetical protein